MDSTMELTRPARPAPAADQLSKTAPPPECQSTEQLSTEQLSTEVRSTDVLSTDVLESELVGLAGHLAAGHCRWLRLLAEFDTRQGWAGPGLRSCAHWLSWRVGMNLRTGFEQLRVAHALTALPAVTEAFTAGRISYSKVRAITRVATATTEATLLDLALAGTASHVERVVRHARQAAADPAATSARRELQWRWNDDGTLDLRGRFTAEHGTQLIAAITALTEPPAAEAKPSVGPETPDECGCAGETAQPRSAEHSHAVGGRPRSAEHSQDCADSSIAARRADALVALATGDRQIDAQLVVILDASAREGSGSAHLQGGPAIPMRTAERVGCNARVRALLRGPRGNPLHLGRGRRLASPAQMTALHIRDQGRCQFPGCDHSRHLEAHHIVHWLRGGRTDLTNLVLICGHHHRLIHDHGYRIRGRGTELTFHRPDGRSIELIGAPTSGNVEGLLAGHTTGPIDDDTITPTWAGERLDLSGVLAGLLPEDAWLAVATL